MSGFSLPCVNRLIFLLAVCTLNLLLFLCRFTHSFYGDFCVYFNATDKSVEIESTGYKKVINVTSGTPTESTTLPANVPAKSFVILKQ